MSVPDYQTLLLPLLRLAGNGSADTLIKAESALANEFDLSPEDRVARLPSGQQTVLRNRTGWASFYLVKAGLLEKPRRGVFYITQEGRAFLADGPSALTVQDLLKLDRFKDFYSKQSTPSLSSDAGSTPTHDSNQTPDEVLQEAYATIREELAAEILDRLLKASPEFFETVVVELLVAMADHARMLGSESERVVTAGLTESSRRTSSAWTPSTSRPSDGTETLAGRKYRSL